MGEWWTIVRYPGSMLWRRSGYVLPIVQLPSEQWLQFPHSQSRQLSVVECRGRQEHAKPLHERLPLFDFFNLLLFKLQYH